MKCWVPSQSMSVLSTELQFYPSVHMKFIFIEPCFPQKTKSSIYFLRCLKDSWISCDFEGAESGEEPWGAQRAAFWLRGKADRCLMSSGLSPQFVTGTRNTHKYREPSSPRGRKLSGAAATLHSLHLTTRSTESWTETDLETLPQALPATCACVL